MSTTDMVSTTEYTETEARGLALVREVEALVVCDTESFQAAGAHLQTIKVYLTRVASIFGPIVQAAHAAHKTALGQQQALEAHAKTADRILRNRMGAYEQEQAQRRREAEAAAQRERERLEAVARAQAKAEQARLRAEAEEQRLAEALAAEAAGDRQSAERLLADPIPELIMPPPMPVFVPPVVVETPKAEGVSFRERWEFELLDAAQLPREYLTPDLKKIGGVVRALKSETHIPGVRVYPVRDVAVRTA